MRGKAGFFSRNPQFSPANLTDLAAWWDASDGSTLFDATSGGSLVVADGGVKRWEDKSGNGRHATQSTDANRPTRKTAIKNGLDVLRFDGSGSRLSVASSTSTFKFMHSQNSSVFVVGKPGTSANPDARYAFIDNNNRDFGVGVSFNYDDRSLAARNDQPDFRISASSSVGASENQDAVSADKFPANTFSLISIVSTPTAAAANRLAMRTNGGSAFASNTLSGAVSSSNAANNLFIGSQANGFNVLNGDIAEILIYSVALSDSDREAVENYLIAKWGLT